MTAKAKKVLNEALALPPVERADVAATLLDRLDEQTDEAVEQAWSAEIERGILEVESGTVKTVPCSHVPRRVEKLA
jgi:putative addiction module component (TIGR02574 family)